MNILFTGSAGYLGRGIVVPFEKSGHTLRLMDVRPFETSHECVIGDVADLEDVRKAVRGVDAVVIAHMAKNPDAYVIPTTAFDVNVKGTANLFFAANEAGVKKIVLISSTSATTGYRGSHMEPHSLPPKAKGMYALTKALQEVIAEQYSREFGMSVAALRVGYVTDADELTDKYGRQISERPALLTDRRDIGEVARLCLERDDIGYEVFNVMSTPESQTECDVAHTCERLNWKPRHDFSKLPLPKK